MKKTGIVIEFTQRNIVLWEREHGGESLSVMLAPQLSSLIEIVKVGNNNCDDDRAYEILEGVLDEEYSLFDLTLDLGEMLVKKGQLPRQAVQAMQEKMEAQLNSLSQM